jgi:hypothetical protein
MAVVSPRLRRWPDTQPREQPNSMTARAMIQALMKLNASLLNIEDEQTSNIVGDLKRGPASLYSQHGPRKLLEQDPIPAQSGKSHVEFATYPMIGRKIATTRYKVENPNASGGCVRVLKNLHCLTRRRTSIVIGADGGGLYCNDVSVSPNSTPKIIDSSGGKARDPRRFSFPECCRNSFPNFTVFVAF